MSDKHTPFVIEKGFWAFLKTLIYDFYMFLQLLLFYAVCLTIGILFSFADKLLKTNRLTDSLASFFNKVGNA